MENAANKLHAADLLIAAACKELGEGAPAFVESCNRHNNLISVVIAAFENLGYREQTVLGMRLGFDAHNGYAPKPVSRYREIATMFELTQAESAGRIYRRTFQKLIASIMEAPA